MSAAGGPRVVLDASAVLAWVLSERGAGSVDKVLAISVVPVSAMVAVLHRAVERGHRQRSPALHADLLALGVRVEPLLDADAVRAAELIAASRVRPGSGSLSLGTGCASPPPRGWTCRSPGATGAGRTWRWTWCSCRSADRYRRPVTYPWRAMAYIGARRATMATLAAAGDPIAWWSVSGRDADVHATYERVRARGPLYRSPVGLRAVTGHAVSTQVLRHPDIGVQLPGNTDFRVDPLATDYPATLSRSFLTLDEPDHARLRRVAAPGFRPVRIRAWQPRLEALADDLARRAAATAAREGAVDLVAAFTAPFPIAVVAELLGVHGADATRFAAIGALVGQGLDGVRTPGQAAAIRAGGVELEAMFTRLLAQRTEEPRDDVLSVVAAAMARGEADAADALGIAGLLLLAGFETTVNLVGNAVAALHERPALWRELVEDPDLAPAVVEEALRHSTPVQATARVPHADVEIAGRPVPAGSVVLVFLAAANRDPEVYARPSLFDPHRSGEADHLAFSSGEHYCLGAALARLEADVALRALAAAMPGMALAPGVRRRPGRVLRGYERLPVTAA